MAALKSASAGAVLADLPIGERAIGVGGGEFRIDLDRLGEILDRVLIAPALGVGDAACVVGDGIVGIALDDVAQRSDIADIGARGVGVDLGDAAGRGRKRAESLAAGPERQRRQRHEHPSPDRRPRGARHHPHDPPTSARRPSGGPQISSLAHRMRDKNGEIGAAANRAPYFRLGRRLSRRRSAARPA